MRTFIQTGIIKSGGARAILSVMFIFSLVWAAAFRQTDTAAVSAQLSNDTPVSPQSGEQTFFNSSQIVINDNAAASPYPSTITVSGVNPATVTKVRVNISGLAHSYPDDVDIVLVGPQGQRAVLMSDAGGNPDLNNVTLQFDQQSSNVLPDSSAISTGVYRPTNYANDTGTLTDGFPAPGPGTLTDAPADLSVFNFINPNGDWKLYVVDDAADDSGTIVDGWTLILTVPTVFTVNSAADTTDGVCNAANCTLREAITAANAGNGGDLINFNFPILQTINLLTPLPDITKSISIQGPGAGLLTVRRDPNAATDFRIFNIPAGAPGGVVAVSGMTIAGGVSNTDYGGGIKSGSKLTLTNVHLTGNQAGLGGGGVALLFADGVFTGCTFNGNQITNANGYGGAIFIDGDFGGRTLRVVNSTVSGNSPVNTGGGIANLNSRLEIINSTIANNTAIGSGGGILTINLGLGIPPITTLRNTIIVGNSPNNLGTGTLGGAATVITNGFNLSDNFNGAFTPAATDITSATPRLAPLAFYRGSTPTHALLFGSPAIDAGNNFGSGVTTDQTGANRTIDLSSVNNTANSDGTDIGAFEAQTVPAAPQFTISDALQSEGNSGTTDFVFIVSLVNPNGQAVSVNYQTADGTATAPSDYTTTGATTLNFAANETSKVVRISVNGDTFPEPDEFFNVSLSNPTGATILDGQGRGTITNDDGSCAYTLSPNSPQSVGAAAGNLTVIVNAPTGCPWTSASNSGFLTVTSGTSGNGDGNTQIAIAANTGAARSGSLTIAGQTYTINQAAGTQTRTRFDFDGDGKADISVFRPSTGVWYLQQSTSGFTGAAFGQNADLITPADFDGDGKTDIAVYRAGTWYLLRSSLGFTGVTFGAPTDFPMPADFDGDRKADICVFRPSKGTWYVLPSTTGTFTAITFGQAGDIPVAADYDGDGKADIAIFRPSNGTWYLSRSTLGFTGISFGQMGDKAVPADYDGDGKADVAVFRAGTWYLLQSTAGFTGAAFGLATDIPAAADYDGDGKADIAVFRPSDGVWYLQQSTVGFTGIAFGTSGDKPVPSAFVP